MKRRPRWSTVTIALAVIAALAIASPGFGVSIRKLVKKEVAKQIANARGPAGANGTNGANGANGTARAYGQVTRVSPFLDAARSKNVASVTNPSTGVFCVTFTAAAGINPLTSGASTSANFTDDDTLPGPPAATDTHSFTEWRSTGIDCTAGTMEFRTGYSQAGGTGEGNSDANEGFFFVVP